MRTILIINQERLPVRSRVCWTALLLVAACGGGTGADDGPLVVATTSILGDVVAQVVGDEARVEVLMPRGADPHDFQASARQAASLREALLVVANGLGLEEGLEEVLAAAESEGVNLLEVAPLLDPIPLRESTDLDPHVWLDPLRVADAAGILATRLEAVAAGSWSSRADEYRGRILEVHRQIEQMVEPLPSARRKLVTSHDALGYFAARYGFEVVGVVSPGGSTLGEPSAAELAALAALMQQEGIPAIFVDSTERTALARALADEVATGVGVVPVHIGSLGGPGSGAETYLDMLLTTAALIVGALE